MNRDKKKIILFLILFCMLLTILGCSGCKKKRDDSKPVSDIEAEKKKDENRYITVINGTDSSTINLVEITAGEGIFVTNKVNPDGKSFSFVIGEVWKDYTDFTVTLVDVYGLKFEKRISNMPLPGKIDIIISEDDYIEQSGDWTRKLERDMNERKGN